MTEISVETLQELKQVISPFFDEEYYRDLNEDVRNSGIDPLDHYLLYGWREGRDPCASFSTNFYLEANPDVALDGIQPFYHYLLWGRAEGRASVRASSLAASPPAAPSPEQTNMVGSFPPDPFPLDFVVNRIREHFDDEFYRRAYSDVSFAGETPIEHFARIGWRQGRDPSPNFNVQFYLRGNLDVAAAGINPLLHYLTGGQAEGRQTRTSNALTDKTLVSDAPTSGALTSASLTGDALDRATLAEPTLANPPSVVAPSAEMDSALQPDIGLISSYVDEGYYFGRYAEAVASGMSAAHHYLKLGWRLNFDPSFDFSTADYLSMHPDVQDAGINPLLHYALSGKREGRPVKRPGGFRTAVLSQARSASERAKAWSQPAPKLYGRGILRADLAPLFQNATEIILAVSHDDFTIHTGGIQLCMRAEQTEFIRNGAVYLQVSPSHALPALAAADTLDDATFCIVCNGKPIGNFAAHDFLDVLLGLKAESPVDWRIIFHSLLGHRPEFWEDCIKALGDPPVLFWVHDYFAACTNFTLLRNDIEYCGGPDVESQACTICIYGEERRDHLRRMRSFFNKIPVTLVAPSQTSLEVWRRVCPFPVANAQVLPHATIDWSNGTPDALFNTMPHARTAVGAAVNGASPPVTVAFLGYASTHKGWPVFAELAQRCGGDNLRFLHFGSLEAPSPNVAFHRVRVTEHDRYAMTAALIDNQVDIVLLWSLWPETFCLTAYEALASGAAIITNSDSGNVTHVVNFEGGGIVFDNEGELLRAFQSGAVHGLARRRREEERRNGRLVLSHVSASVPFADKASSHG